MTDDITPQPLPPPKKDEKKPPASGNTRGIKRNVSNSSNSRGASGQGPRPSSRTSNKKSASSTPAPESGSDTQTSKKGSESSKKPDQRNKNQSGATRSSNHRKAQPSASQGARLSTTKEQPLVQPSPVAPPISQGKESSDALSSLQRVIADLKSTSPVQQASNTTNTFAITTTQSHSNLPPHAPVFHPGAAGYPGLSGDPKHRKAASMGPTALSGNFNSFSPHLGAMMEDVEDGASFEEGEIQERFYSQPGHQPRSQSQSFMAPRFAALAAQEQSDAVGPTGRPQLAPNFMFGAGGARKRNSPMGPPINEEDISFQFPQQQQNFDTTGHEQTHRKTDSGEITGIMAEQVQSMFTLNRT